MAVKYECPKCGRRFAEWGASKLDFHCPKDDHCPPGAENDIIELVRVGGGTPTAAERPALRRRPAKKVVAAAAPAVVDEDAMGDEDVDLAVVGSSEDFEDEADVEVEAEEEEEAVVVGAGARKPPAEPTEEDDDEGESFTDEVPEVLDFEGDAEVSSDDVEPIDEEI